MGYWNVSAADVEAADAMPWEGRLHKTMRPFSYRTFVRAGLAGAVLWSLGGVAVFVMAATASRTPGAHPAALVAIGITVTFIGVGTALLSVLAPPAELRRLAPVGVVSIFSGGILVSALLLAAGPHLSTAAATYVESLLFAFYMLRRRWAVFCGALTAAEYALVLWQQDGVAAPGTHWVILTSIVITSGVVMGIIAETAERLTESEHVARVQLAEVNRTLEARVQEQVDELESLGRLRRFLSPQVAEAVTSTGSERLLEPHRRQIAVFFCDLRGFTTFTNQAEPEEVLRVLDEYYATVGELLRRYDATIGGYSGDGIMAYFGDPVARDDPALDAVRMANDLRIPLDEVVVDWQRRGYSLSYGIGLSYGYATLGVIGFDGRYDYTPLGAVVNLAARLCSSASAAQVLLDHATHAATSAHAESSRVADLDLKGFGSATRAYSLTATAG